MKLKQIGLENMAKIDAKKLYVEFKKGERNYKEDIHCPMILEVMNTEGTMTAFCKKAQISDRLFYKWTYANEIFRDCYEFGKILSKCNWEEEGEAGKDQEFFNFDYWRLIGAQRYGIGKNRIRMGIDAVGSPYEQYKQLVERANSEDFNASEIKQLMESINVGIRAYESFELQGQINKVKDDVSRMEIHSANNSNTIEKATKTD